MQELKWHFELLGRLEPPLSQCAVCADVHQAGQFIPDVVNRHIRDTEALHVSHLHVIEPFTFFRTRCTLRLNSKTFYL